MKIIRNLFSNFFDTNQKISFFFLLFLMLMSSMLEIFGISLIIPLISAFLGTEIIANDYISKFFELIKLENFTSIDSLLMVFGLIFFFKFLFLLYFYNYQTKFIYKFKEKLSNKLFFSYLNKNYDSLRRNSSVLLSNIINEVDFATNYLDSFSKLLLDLVVVFFISIFLLYYNFHVSIIIILILSFFILFYFSFFKEKIKKWGEKRFISTNKRIQYLTEGIKGNKIIKITNSENFFYEKFIQFNKIFRIISVKIMFLGQLPKILLEFLGIVLTICLIFYASKISFDTNYIIELLGVFLFAFFKIVPSLNRIIGSLQIMRYIKLSVNLIVDEKINQDFSEKTFEKISFNKNVNIKIDRFIFKDESNEQKNILLKDIDLNIAKSEKIGIIGPSGSGKSTFLEIFSGLIETKNKSIFVDGNSVKENIRGWQKIIGYVPQKTFIIEDTLRNNLLFGFDSNKVNDKHFNEILSKSNLNQLVSKMPDGLDTIIREDGSNFSGGEVQRIGLARALLRKPQILILDEATSALDLKNEEEIIKDLLKIEDLTIISVTHRLSALKGFTKVYNLQSGKLILA